MKTLSEPTWEYLDVNAKPIESEKGAYLKRRILDQHVHYFILMDDNKLDQPDKVKLAERKMGYVAVSEKTYNAYHSYLRFKDSRAFENAKETFLLYE